MTEGFDLRQMSKRPASNLSAIYGLACEIRQSKNTIMPFSWRLWAKSFTGEIMRVISIGMTTGFRISNGQTSL